MKYSTFERLIAVVGFASVGGSVVFSLLNAMPAEEIVAQLLLLVVLLSSVHWGRRGGFVSALVASGIYVLLRIPVVLGAQGLTTDITTLLLIRLVTYGLIGIVGGELCGRIQYIFARLDDSASIDDWSHVYNQRFIVHSLETVRGQHTRYDTPYSIILVGLSTQLTEGLRVSKQRAIVRGVANHVRNDIRLVDEVGRLDDGRYLVILPQTPKPGAMIVAERLRTGICETVGAKESSVMTTVLGAPDDDSELTDLAADLAADSAPIVHTAESSS